MDSTQISGIIGYEDANGPFAHRFCGLKQVLSSDGTDVKTPVDSSITADINTFAQCIHIKARKSCLSEGDNIGIPVKNFGSDLVVTGDIQKLAGTDAVLDTMEPTSERVLYNYKVSWTVNMVDKKSGTITHHYGTQPVGAYYIDIGLDFQKSTGYGSLNSNLGQALRIQAGGKTLYDGPINGDGSFPGGFFNFNRISVIHNDAGSPLSVVVTYSAPNGLDPNTDVTTLHIQVSLTRVKQVINPSNYACTTTCPERIGYNVGLASQGAADYVTFFCVYCDSSLNQVFDALAGQCTCAPYYT